MSNIITARDPYIIAAEINTIKRQVQETMIAGSLRIGEKLQEAKSLVPQGEWGKWLEENVEYSQSTAENLMKLYREYGTNQQSLFDTWTSSQTFGKLSYTQHLALLAFCLLQNARSLLKKTMWRRCQPGSSSRPSGTGIRQEQMQRMQKRCCGMQTREFWICSSSWPLPSLMRAHGRSRLTG